jgi:phage head maturation protease
MEDGIHIREIRDMDIFEVSVVSFPAYQATDVSLASQEAFREYRAALSKRDTEMRMRMAR